MNEKINRFLDSVCACIKYKPVHQDIRNELTVHIIELKDKFAMQTQNEETALDMAISSMGDSNEIGMQLNKRHKPETEWSLISLTAIIAIIGGAVMYVSSLFESAQAISFERYLTFAIVGVVVMAGLYFFDYTKLKKMAWPIYLLALTFLILNLIFGAHVNGRSTFVFIGIPITTEFTTLLFLISFTGFIDKSRGKGYSAIFKLILIALISIFPIIMQPRISQALTLIIGYAVLIITAVAKNHFYGSKRKQLTLLAAMAFLCGLLLATGTLSGAYSSYRLYRIYAFIRILTTGRSDPTGADYQRIMADKWLKASSLFGATTEKVSGYELDTILPGVTTDYVLINVIASLGWIIGITLIICIAIYIGRLFVITKKIRNDYGFYICLATSTTLAVQFMTGILVNFNMLPTASVYIPLISYGGVGYVTSMALIGLFLSVCRRNNLIPAA